MTTSLPLHPPARPVSRRGRFHRVTGAVGTAAVALVLTALASTPAAAQGGLKPEKEFNEPADATPVLTPSANETRDQMVARALQDGMAQHPAFPIPDADAWKKIAYESNLSYDDLLKSYDAIWVVHLAYQKLLGRAPETAGANHWLGHLRGGMTWETMWRMVAHSPERERTFGAWAPAPYDVATDAQRDFGLSFAPTPEQCFGGLGDKCEGGIPTVANDQVQPIWNDTFMMPDGTRMGYVDIGVAVGSILHDNVCLRDRGALNCNGLGWGDLVKSPFWAGSLEWNKATYNTTDRRAWRQRFGPYPTDQGARRARWFDDLRPMPAREAWMAPVVSIGTVPYQTVRYAGNETRESRRLAAPAGARLDWRDQQMCRSGAFSSVGNYLPGLAPAGICQ
jgi:hypothetical protein